jgi:hypothetical protein
MLDGPATVANPGLIGTSAWANNFLGRDHQHVAQSPSEDNPTKP